jgi:aspartyl/asparaginyl beta-hydroxylase (cupin superfamily)
MAQNPGLMQSAIESAIKSFQKRVYKVVGGEQRPVFFNVAETAPSMALLQQNHLAIRAEVEALLRSNAQLPTYHELDPNQKYISGGDQKKWKVFMLYAMGVKPEENRARCPVTASLLDQVPDLFQAFFSILEAGKSVPAHNGPHLGYVRYHLGLIVPKENPPSIRVKDQIYTWKEGEGVLFDDSWNHEVMNQSTSDRVILLVDTLRPLPMRLHLFNLFYSKVLVRIAYASGIMKNLERFR